MNQIEKEIFQPTVLTFNRKEFLSKRPSGVRQSPWGTVHLLVYLAILQDMEANVLSPDQEIIFSIEAEKEYGARRSTHGKAGEKRSLSDLLNQAISLNAPDCIVALFDVYGGLKGALRRINKFIFASNYSRKTPTGRKMIPQLSNIYDYYQIGEEFLHLSEESFKYIRNHDHVINGEFFKAQSQLESQKDIIASIFWGTNQSDCFVFYKENRELTCSLVINGENYSHSAGLAMNPEFAPKEYLVKKDETISHKQWLEQTFEGYFLNDKLGEDLVIEHTVCDPTLTLRNNWKNVAYISLSAESYRAIIPKAKRDFHGNEIILKYKVEEHLSVIVTDEPILSLKDEVPQFIVPNSLTFAYHYAAYQMGNYHGKFCALTGSVGKSSTRLILEHLLKNEGNILANMGNANLHYPTFSLSVEINDQYDTILFEAAGACMNRLGYGNNAFIWKTDVVVIPSFGSAHVVDGVENNLCKKKELFFSVKEDGYVIINKDMDEAHLASFIEMANLFKLNVLLFSFEDMTADCYMLEKKVFRDKTDVRISFRGKEVSFSLTTDSDGQIQNAMGALLAVECLGYSIDKMAPLLEDFHSLKRVLRPIPLTLDSKEVTVIDDTHNSAIESMMNGIDFFTSKKPFYKGKNLLVLGEVDYLGNEKEARYHHERLIPHINRANPDQAIFYGKSFKDLPVDIGSVTWCETKEQVVEKIMDEITEDSLVFIKGSYGETEFYKVTEMIKKKAENN
ncbi:Mur ligase family protein [Enterococcus sp. DIV0756]|uniref:Mur ligase family protein n=1 Tax=Enterococcus sp. DIV0756 TaxID=2774636 RepID=UPI003F22E5F2